jgi:hypothetical protein
MSTTIRIQYKRSDTDHQWNEVCARAVEMFGLPGDRFTTNLNRDHIDFVFKNNKDAMMFAIEHNGRFVSEEELTTELVGKYFN